MTLEPNQKYYFNNFRFDHNYYNKSGENDVYTFVEFCNMIKKLCEEKNYIYKEHYNSYKKIPNIVAISVET